jgi:hypothetical protein
MHCQTNRHRVAELADQRRQTSQIEERIEELREEDEIINNVLSLFIGRCGHRWVGASDGSYACPLCNDHDGDHHLVSMEAIAVQADDWGMAWESLCNLQQPLRISK